MMNDTQCENSWRVSIDNIGDAGIHTVSALVKAFNEDYSSVAKRMLQAPSLLLQNLGKTKAQQIAQLLEESGLKANASLMSEPFQHGDNEHEIALSLTTFNHMNQLISEIMMLTGIDLKHAIRVLCSMPSVLLGNISKNNAESLQQRFQKMGAELDFSRPRTARYDVFIQTDSYIVRKEIKRIVESLSIAISENNDGNSLAATDLDYTKAHELWNLTQEKKIQCRLINRDYQRFDVTLTDARAANTKTLTDILTDKCRIPKAATSMIINKLPLVISNNITLQNAQDLMVALKECGADSRADLISCLTFQLKFETYEPSEKSHSVLKKIGNVNANAISKLDRGRSKILEGPFSYNQAKWLMYELKALGSQVVLVKK
jgi:ribosomal protein L7/L12